MNKGLLSMALAMGMVAALSGCDGGGGGGSGGSGGGGGSAPALALYTTCGDPACSMDSDDPNLPDCTTEKEGDPCTTEGQTCEIVGDTCNANLVCATSDPKDQPGGCPISLASAKHDIEYLSEADRERIRGEVASMPLATWRYDTEEKGEKEHLGFIIDDQPASSPAVRPSGERVDLYGYTSMAVAAIQAQEKEIDALRQEIEALREELLRRGSGAGLCAPRDRTSAATNPPR